MTSITSEMALSRACASRSSVRSAAISACALGAESCLLFLGEVRVVLFGEVRLAFFEAVCFA
jgi:hypothetical protein